jgi:hypothetical protein
MEAKRRDSASYLLKAKHKPPRRLRRTQLYVMTQRLEGKPCPVIADLIGVTVGAIYMRMWRAMRALPEEQRTRYVEALKRNSGRRVRVRPMSLSFTNQ